MYLTAPDPTQLQHLNSISHEGKVVIFATGLDGKIYYSVRQDGFEDSYLNTPEAERTGWEKWEELAFPDEENEDASVVAKETAEFTHKQADGTPGEFLMRSRYQTQNLSAIAPVQLVSALGHIYVFRQSKDHTLLCDRFVLDGITNKLTRKLEVRFKRSRQKYQPIADMKMGEMGLQNVDSLDYRDSNGEFFYEPTTELKLINNLHQGWFSVVQVPTNEHDIHRWHIFAYNSATSKAEITTLRVSKEGLFELKDYLVLEPASDTDDTLVPRSIPGVIQRSLNLSGGTTITNGLVATKYDIQNEQETKDGPQLMRMETRIMLAIPTDQGIVTVSFGIAEDGTLAIINKSAGSTNTVVRSDERDVLLPITTLDDIRVFGDTTPPPQGTVTALSAAHEDDGNQVEDLVKITSPEATDLKTGALVDIYNTQDYNGLYVATAVDANTFTIPLPDDNPMASWEAIEPERGLVFDGKITAYERTPDNQLKLTAVNHGLSNGDQVLLTGLPDYTNTYSIQKIDDHNFVIQRFWPQIEAVNVEVLSQRRRGIVLSGDTPQSYVDCGANLELANRSFTIEFWATRETPLLQQYLISQGTGNEALLIGFRADSGDFSGNYRFFMEFGGNSVHSDILPGDQDWHHWACTYDSQTQTQSLYRDGQLLTSKLTTSNCLATGNFYLGYSATHGQAFYGRLAESRVWEQARSQKELKDSMYGQLTGKEVGLLGYWRLGTIITGTSREVIDFSAHGNNGIVHGDAYVGGVALSGTLADNTTRAAKYSNEELVAVRQRATYIETFEIKLDNPPSNPNNVNGKPLFQVSCWGKSNRYAEEKIPIEHVEQNIEDQVGTRWRRVTARYTIPDGVAMLRSFEIKEFALDWDSLEVRNHSLRLVSDAITEAAYSDPVNAEPLGNQTTPPELRQLAGQENRQGYLIQAKQRIEKELALLRLSGRNKELAIQAKQLEINNKEKDIQKLMPDVTYWRDEKVRGQGTITVYADRNYSANHWKTYGLGYYSNIGLDWRNDDVDSVRFWNSGLKVTLYDDSWYGGESETLYSSDPDIRLRNRVTSMKVETINGNHSQSYIHQQLEIKESELNAKQKALEKLREELLALQQEDTDKAVEILVLEAQLAAIEQQLQAAYFEAASLNQTLLATIQQRASLTFAMPKLNPDTGLATYGATLGFMHPVSRLNILETCEGNVQLSYLDDRGQMRHTHYDATADANNSASEQWVPDSLQSCLNFDHGQSSLKLSFPVPLGDVSSLEAWFSYPFVQEQHWYVLASSQDEKAQVVVFQGQYLGLRLNGRFIDCGYSLDQLMTGWHHLALTTQKNANTTLFYIDGEKVGEAQALLALQLDGDDDYITLPEMNVDYGLGLTLEAWVRYSNFDHWSRIIELRTSSSDNNIVLGNEANTNTLFIEVGGQKLSAPSALETESWMHIAVTVTAYGDATIYKNGQIIKQGIDSEAIVAPATVLRTQNFIGKSDWPDSGSWQGKLAEVRLWKAARAQHEIQADMGKALKGDELGLVGYWQFAEQKALDSSSTEGKFDGTINGTPSFLTLAAKLNRDIGTFGNTVNATGSAPPPEASTVNAADNEASQALLTVSPTALAFNGSSDYIEVDYQPTLNSEDFTVSLWVKVTGGQGQWRAPLTSRDGSPVRGYLFYANRYDQWDFRLGDGVGSWGIVTGPDVQLDTWIHLAATVSGGQATLYIDGDFYAQESLNYSLNTQRPLRIGAGTTEGSAKYYFPGEIAEVQVWNIVRSEADIKAGMSQALAGNEVGLVGYWPLRDGSIQDLSPNQWPVQKHGDPQTVPFDQLQSVAPSTAPSTSSLTALEFEGTGDYITTPVDAQPAAMTATTWEAWVKPTYQQSTWKNLFVTTDAWGGRAVMTFNDRFQIYHGTDTWFAATVDYDEWQHIAVVYAADGSIKFYKNGVESAYSGTASFANSSTDETLTIGASPIGSSPFTGAIAEVRVWRESRTKDEIFAWMKTTLAGDEPGLAAYWPLRERSAEDLSIAGHNGTVRGNPQTVPFDKVKLDAPPTTSSTALRLNGSTDYVEIPAHHNPTAALTVSVWAKSNTPTWNDNGMLVSKRDAFVVHPLVGGTSINFYIYTNGWQLLGINLLNLDENFDIMVWHHYALTFDGQKMCIYIDGQFIAEDSVTGTIKQDSGALFIGKDDGMSRYFNGEIAEVRVWDKARTEAEIQGDMRIALKGDEPNLVGYWPLRDSSAKDYSNSNHGDSIIHGSPQPVVFDHVRVPVTEQIATSISQTALKFNGSTDYVETAPHSSPTTAITVSCWAKSNTSTWNETGVFASKRSAFILSPMKGTKQIRFYVDVSGFKSVSADLSSDIQLTEWHHYAGTFDGQKISIYFDGQFQKSLDMPGNITADSGALFIGKDDDHSRYFDGEIAEVKVWNKALTEAEIQGDMRIALKGDESNLVGY